MLEGTPWGAAAPLYEVIDDTACMVHGVPMLICCAVDEVGYRYMAKV